MRLDSGWLLSLGNVLLGASFSAMVGMVGSEWVRQQVLSLPEPPPTSRPAVAAGAPEDSGRTQESFAEILEANIFRAKKKSEPLPPPSPPPPVEQPSPSAEEAIPQTRLNLSLAGTMLFSENNGFAFISPKGQLGNYRIFELGECFDPNTVQTADCGPNSVKVLEIADREVLLVFRDLKQRLLMEEDLNAAAAAAPAPPPPKTSALVVPPTSSKKQEKASEPKASQSSEPAPPPAAEGQTTFNFTRVWVDEQLANFNQILMDARVVATETDPPRFMFKYIKKGSLYEQLGLKTNDVILEVNGFVIDSLPKALKLMETLQAEREIALKVERNEQPVLFNYYID
jgi:hypothetical protein